MGLIESSNLDTHFLTVSVCGSVHPSAARENLSDDDQQGTNHEYSRLLEIIGMISLIFLLVMMALPYVSGLFGLQFLAIQEL